MRLIANPLDHIYLNYDAEFSTRDDIQELLETTLELGEAIEGDLELAELTARIRRNQLSFVYTGLIAHQIKSKALYKKTHSNFDHYCREQLGVSYWQIADIIVAADVVMELAAFGFEVLPQNINQGEKLAAAGGTERVRIWREIVETHEPYQITGKLIEEYIAKDRGQVLPKSTQTFQVSMDEELYFFLWALGHFVFGIQGVTTFLTALFETNKKLGNSLTLESLHENLNLLYQEHHSEVNRE